MKKGGLEITVLILLVLGVFVAVIVAALNPEIVDRAEAVFNYTGDKRAEQGPEAIENSCDSKCLFYCANDADTDRVLVTVDGQEVLCASESGAGADWTCEC